MAARQGRAIKANAISSFFAACRTVCYLGLSTFFDLVLFVGFFWRPYKGVVKEVGGVFGFLEEVTLLLQPCFDPHGLRVSRC